MPGAGQEISLAIAFFFASETGAADPTIQLRSGWRR